MWMIAAMHGENAARLAPRFNAAVERHRARPELQEAWRAWCENSDLQPGYFPDPQPGKPNQVSAHLPVAAFAALACDMVWEDRESHTLHHECMSACDPAVNSMVVLVRSESPVAALFHGIGPARANQLPGWMGNFLLAPDEALALRAQVEAALTMPADETAKAIQRVRDWLNQMGDGDQDAEELMSGPLRAWHAAVDAGLGVCGMQAWVT
jgi:hypothetical protein